MKMTELYQEYTVRSLMERTDLTYTKSYEVIRKMREKGLVQDVKKVNGVGVMNAKRIWTVDGSGSVFARGTGAKPRVATAPRFFQQPI
jgi:hypothetical protein